MQRRTWEAQAKAMMVIEGLHGKPVAEICTAHHSRHSPYDQGRDPLLAHAAQALASQQSTTQEARLERENTRVKPLVGELTFERKQSDARPG
jgi:hypothetical protein